MIESFQDCHRSGPKDAPITRLPNEIVAYIVQAFWTMISSSHDEEDYYQRIQRCGEGRCDWEHDHPVCEQDMPGFSYYHDNPAGSNYNAILKVHRQNSAHWHDTVGGVPHCDVVCATLTQQSMIDDLGDAQPLRLDPAHSSRPKSTFQGGRRLQGRPSYIVLFNAASRVHALS